MIVSPLNIWFQNKKIKQSFGEFARFNGQTYIYMKGVFLNTSRKMIIFEDIASDIPLDNKI